MKPNKESMQTVLQKIKQGERTALAEIYQLYREEFLKWALQHFYCKQSEAEDVYQDAIIAFYENVCNDKLNSLKCSFKTYLFAIGKNMLLGMAKKKQRKSINLDDVSHLADDNDLVIDKISLSEKENIVYQAIKSLGEPCQSILNLYYYEKYSIKKIVKALKYKSDNVAKVQKVRCMKRLRSIIENTELNKKV